MKILNMILRPGEPHFAALTKRFPDDRFVELATIDDLRREAPDADAFITSAMPYTPELAEVLRARAPRLRWMQSRSAGLDRFIAAGIPKGKRVGLAEDSDWQLTLDLMKKYREVETSQPATAFYTNEFLTN